MSCLFNSYFIETTGGTASEKASPLVEYELRPHPGWMALSCETPAGQLSDTDCSKKVKHPPKGNH